MEAQTLTNSADLPSFVHCEENIDPAEVRKSVLLSSIPPEFHLEIKMGSFTLHKIKCADERTARLIAAIARAIAHKTTSQWNLYFTYVYHA